MKFIATIIAIAILASCSQDQKSSEVQSNFNKIEVEEVLQTSSYTYLFGKVNGESLWLATLKLNASVGDTFYYKGGLEMIDFNSKELDRIFESVIFLEGVYTSEANLNEGANNSGSPQITNSAASTINSVIEPVEGGVTIAELMANKSEYEGKVVKLKGTVVKYNAGIMGKNWIHIQDGTANGTENDLTVTTEMSAKVGDIIIIEGVITLDKDFGAGYFYKIIVEEGKIMNYKL